MSPIASPRTELGPTVRPVRRSRAGQTSRARGDALTRVPDAAWRLMWQHAERSPHRRDGLIALLVFQVPLRKACRITRDRHGQLHSDEPHIRERLARLDAEARARVDAWFVAEPNRSADALETWLARALTQSVRGELRAGGVLWADYLSLSTRRIRARGLEYIWEKFRDRPALIRVFTGSPQLIDRRQYLQPTAVNVNRLGESAAGLARPLAALRDNPAVRAALDRLDGPDDMPLSRTTRHRPRRR